MDGINIYASRERWKTLLFLMAVAIGIGSLMYTNKLVNTLAEEEHKKVQLWAEATTYLAQSEPGKKEMLFYLRVMENNTTVPVILVGPSGEMEARNLDSLKSKDPDYLAKQLKIMKSQNPPIEILMNDGQRSYIYYKESILLNKLTWYPYIQLTLILLFIIVAYFAFSSSRKAEQNQVWVGLSKETAHQLGTPASSLSAWVEVLRYHLHDEAILHELEKDVTRLKVIADRFSKIGSMPKLGPTNIRLLLEDVMEYMKRRSSNRAQMQLHLPENEIILPLSASLFEWVIENVCKNAMDAMEGKGNLDITVSEGKTEVYVDIADTGKGIPKKLQKTIFKPGFTTKSRGWGLGLSLAKRIVELYHRGKIFVLQSEVDKGTTIRIVLKKAMMFE